MEAKEIAKLREQLNLTQRELADRLKVDAITVSRWELGTSRPQPGARKRLERLARKVGK